MNVLDMLEKEQMRADIPGFKPGDTVKVYVKIIEGQKERIQVFQGSVITQEGRAKPRHFYRKKNNPPA